jgi:nucleoside-diphosphate-sugar epimerase
MTKARPQKTAVVVGALGVIGRYIVDRLAAESDWQVIGLSRRAAVDRERVHYVSIDLLAPFDLASLETSHPGVDFSQVTHIFYAAFQPATGKAAGYAENIAPNHDMLVNSVSAIDAVSSCLERVVLVTGTKYYGTHLGPFKTPARESDPRHAGANYYFDQCDWLSGFQRGKHWDYVELRPQTLCGFAPGTAMSIVSVIAVYAAIMKELGRPFAFPGIVGGGRAIYQVTDSAHFANAALWAANGPRCANEAYNITNGDYFRWLDLWPRLAEVFEMPHAAPTPLPLTEFMADKAPLWDSMVRKYDLKQYRLDEVVAWPFGDYVFNTTWDVMSNLNKARQHGFNDLVDTEEMFVRQLTQFRREKIVP